MTQSESDVPDLIMPPPLFPLAALAIAAVLDWIVAVPIFAPPGLGQLQFWIGLVLVAAGLALVIQAVVTMRAAGTNVEPYKPSLKIVSSGPYRFTRNPIYLGFVIVYCGLCLVFALEWGILLIPFLWLALDRLVVAREESYLGAKFGDEYTHYLAHTRRWI